MIRKYLVQMEGLMSAIDLSRRAIVAGASVLPALAVPVIASASTEPDPIFAAIEAHRRAYAEFVDVHEAECALEDELPKEKCRSSITTYKETIFETDDPRLVPAMRATIKMMDLADEGAANLFSTEPTTMAGIRSLLKYYADIEAIDGGEVWPKDMENDDDAALKGRGASAGYFVARNVGTALEKLAAAV